MDTEIICSLAKATMDGSMPFPQIVGKLIDQGVEYYHVDFAANSFTFYGSTGSVISTPIAFTGMPAISPDFDATALKSAILDSQKNGQKFRQFCERAVGAGVQGYYAFLRGQRVVYFGRQGDQHVEWFPGVKPTDVV